MLYHYLDLTYLQCQTFNNVVESIFKWPSAILYANNRTVKSKRKMKPSEKKKIKDFVFSIEFGKLVATEMLDVGY